MLQYVSDFKDRLWSACQVARENLHQAQNHMKAWFDRKAVDHRFAVGDKVLALVPQRASGLSASFCGPYTVLKRVGDKNYVISTPEGRRKTRLCHVNLLKKYQGRSSGPPVACAAMVQILETDVSGGSEVACTIRMAGRVQDLSCPRRGRGQFPSN